jgi:predicted HTH domain antitoxin
MQITIDIPADIEQRLQTNLDRLSQRALEAIAVEAYRAQVISAAEVQRMLKLPSHLATDAFLKQAGAFLHYTEEDLEQDIQAMNRVVSDS